MNKRRFLTLTIITTIISLAMILLSYFGITRYFMLHIKPSEGYANSYTKLPDYDKEKTTRIVMASTADRLKNAKASLSSIFDQTFKTTGGIHVYLPQSDMDEAKKSLSKTVRDNLVFLPRKNISYGDSLCDSLIPSMLSEREGDTMILVVRDDMIYGKDFVENILTKADKSKDSVIQIKNKAIVYKPNMMECTAENTCNSSDYKTIEDILKKCKTVNNHNYNEIYKTFKNMT